MQDKKFSYILDNVVTSGT